MQAAVVVVVVTLCGAAAAIGPPPGSRGTIDFRYPDYIVSPLVPCPHEGVFPHPRNCTWYYRCYDRYGRGFFWRAYFECEPGTVFSDALDQCVWGYVNENCSIPVPPSTTEYSTTVTVPTPTTPEPPCEYVYYGCTKRAVCPQLGTKSMYVPLVETCVSAVKMCPNTEQELVCSGGYQYNKQEKECFKDMNFCKPSIPVSLDGIVCRDRVVSCSDYYTCPNNPDVPEVVRRCDIQHICTRGGVQVSHKSICPSGQTFDAFTNECKIDVPVYSGCYPSIATKYGQPVAPTCKIETEICIKNKEVCNKPGETATVCSQFFSCEQNYRGRARDAGYGVTGSSCVEVADLPQPPSPTCEVSLGSCRQAAFCPTPATTSLFVQTVQVCDVANNICQAGSNSSSAPLCPATQVYDTSDGLCKDESTICGPSVRPLAPIVCEDVLDGCQDLIICPNTPDVPEVVRRCDLTQKCYREGVLVGSSPVCPGGKFDAFLNTCINDNTDATGGCALGIAAGAGASGTAGAPGALPSLPSRPSCRMLSEVCSMRPLCQGVDSALVCRRYFSCDLTQALTGSRRTAAYPTAPSDTSSCLQLVLPPVPTPTPQPAPVCSDNVILSECTQEAICPSSFQTSLFVQSVQICRGAERPCSDGSVIRQCGIGEVYVKDYEQCTPGSQLCQPPDDRPQFPIVCVDELENCQDSPVCNSSPFKHDVVRRCDLYRTCRQDGVQVAREPICQGGRFDAKVNQCGVDSPGVYTCAASVPASLPAPQCEMESEVCEERPVCNTDLSALVCHHLFSCVPSEPVLASRAASYSSTVLRQASTECVPIPALESPPAPVTCDVLTLDQCSRVAACPQDDEYTSSVFVQTVEVCTVAQRSCTDGSSSLLCAPGELYFIDREECGPAPRACQLPPRPPASLVCVDEIANCTDTEACLSSRYEPVVTRRCDMFRTCSRDGLLLSREPVCQGGKYDAIANQCVDDRPAAYKCLAPSAPPAVPQCGVVSEVCEERPVCQSPETALVCRHVFACDGHLVGPSLRSAPSAAVTSPSCVLVPSVTPAVVTCELHVADCQYRPECPANYSSSQFVPVAKICAVTENVCSDQTIQPVTLCPPGQLYEKETDKCHPSTAQCPPSPTRDPSFPLVCEDILEGCQDSYICPNAPEVHELVRRCDLTRVCKKNGVEKSRISLCPDGKFDAFLNQCVPDSTGGVECNPAMLPPGPQQPTCEQEGEQCAKKSICKSTDFALQCVKLFSCQWAPAFVSRGGFREADSDCIPDDSGDSIIPETIPITCSFAEEISISAKAREFYCQKNAMCDLSGKFAFLHETCRKFYRCKLINNVLTGVEETCPAGQALEYATKTCIQQNTDSHILCSDLSSIASPMDSTPTTAPTVTEITTTTPTPTTAPPIKEEFPQNWVTTLECSKDKEIPSNADVKKINCDITPLCSNGIFQGTEELCRKFYVCRWDGSHFLIDEMECTGGLMFSYERKECVEPSTNVCHQRRVVSLQNFGNLISGSLRSDLP